MEKDTNYLISEKACEIFILGVMDERKRMTEYFQRCADTIDFGTSSPNDVIRELLKIITEEREDNYT